MLLLLLKKRRKDIKSVIVSSYRLNTIILIELTKDLNDQDTSLKTGDSNTIGWILGHIILSRGSVLKLLEEDYDKVNDEEKYKRGSEKNSNIKIDIKDTSAEFEKRGRQIINAIKSIDEEILSRELKYKLPNGGNTIRDAIVFSSWHETFHIGQIDLILAANGKSGIR